MSKRTIIISCVICIGLIVFVIVGLTGGNIGQPGKETQNADASSQSTVTECTASPEAEQLPTDASSADTKKNSVKSGTSQKSADPTDSKSELEEEDIVQSPEGLELPPERIEGTQEHEQGPGQDQPQSPGQGRDRIRMNKISHKIRIMTDNRPEVTMAALGTRKFFLVGALRCPRFRFADKEAAKS